MEDDNKCPICFDDLVCNEETDSSTSKKRNQKLVKNLIMPIQL